jgi:hypothetical protein
MASIVEFTGNEISAATANALVAETLIEGNAVSSWWTRQSAEFLEGFMDRMRTSVQNGESVTQGITRVIGGTLNGVQIPGMMKTSKKNAGALVSSAINAVTNQARISTFQENRDVIKGIQQVSTFDNRTSDVCIAYSGKAWDIETLEPIDTGAGVLPFNGGPPRHFNCRSTLVPILKSFRELGLPIDEIPPGTRASMDGQVPGDMSFGAWLKTKSETFQNNLLGPSRANLWRNGKITLTQLVDMRGNPMTLDQLETKVGMTPAAPPAPRKPTASEFFKGKTASETKMLDEGFGRNITPFVQSVINETAPLKEVIEDLVASGRAKKSGAAWYEPWSKTIVNERRGRPDISYFSTHRHEYGHHVDFALYKRWLEKTGAKPILRRKFHISDRLSAHLEPSMKSVKSKIAGKRGKQYEKHALSEKLANEYAEKVPVSEVDMDGFYADKFKKYGVDWEAWKRLVHENYEADYFVGELHRLSAHALASFEVGNPTRVIGAMTAGKLIKGGGKIGKLSDYFSATTQNAVRGSWGHSNAYYKAEPWAAHTEAFANAFTMLGDDVNEALWRQLLKAWNSDDFLNATERMLKELLEL